ncbi:hypothetical protein LIER_18931 [Lithospermum erythrorhizon]|uniref:Uncharacterized protein n=1 Tax=Lithospermum erythrorhizon TaxID=34254 RepID=A0AAV3QIT9_LITER
MNAAIINSLLHCSLSEAKSKPIRLDVEDLAEGIIESELSVYAKILSLTESFISIQSVRIALSKAWNCQDLRVLRVAGPILHVFFPLFRRKRGYWKVDLGDMIINS